MADSWADFGGPPSQSAAPTPVVAGAQARADDGWAAFGGAPDMEPTPGHEAPTPAAPSAPAKSGMAANIGAGMVEGGAGIINTIADPVGNLVGKPLATLMVTGHDLLAPAFGYDKFSPKARADLLGDTAPQIGTRAVNAIADTTGSTRPEDVQPATTGQALVRAGTAGAVGMAGINGLIGAPTGAGTALSALLGGAGGVTGEAVSQLVSDEYKPIANLVGNVAGAGAVGAGVSMLGSGGRMVGNYVAPAFGKLNPLLEGLMPILDARGQPVTATSRQATMAGDRIQAAASDPAAAQKSLNALLSGGPTREIVPGAAPTTAQATRDPGLLQLERGVSRATSDASADFKARADAQNDARVQSIGQMAAGADPAAVPRTVQSLTNTVDQAATRQVTGAQTQAGQALDAMGGNLPAGSESMLGQMLRTPLQESKASRAGW